MDEATKGKLKAAGLEGVVTAFETQAAAMKTLEDGKKAAEKLVAEKDAIISQKNDDLVGQRREFKKLSEMTEAEKSAMSAKEIELQERAEAHEADVKKFREEQAASLKKEVDARRERAITKLAGNDPELKKKIEDNYGRILDNDKAQTEEEIGKVVGDAFNMTGQPKPDPVRAAMQGGGQGEAGAGEAGSFAESKEGKELAGAMGLVEPKPAEAAPAAGAA